MDAGKIKRSVYLTVLSVLSVPFSSAQITDGGGGGFGSIGGGSLGNSGVEASLVEFANTILLFQVDSAASVLLYFVAPMAGFYFVQKNMLSYGFELFEERIDRHTYGRTDDEVPNGIKGLSIVTGFITVQMLGMFGAGFLLVTGLLSILLAILMQLGLLDEGLDWGGGGGGNAGGGGNNNNNGGNNNGGGGQQQGGGGGNVDWNQVGQAAAGAVNNISQAQQNRNYNKIGDALDVFSPGTDIIDIIDKEPSDFRDHVSHIRDGKENDASDLNSLENVDERMQDIEGDMSDLESALRSDSSHTGGLNWNADSELQNYDYRQLLQKLTNVREELKRIKNDQKNQAPAMHDHLDESWDDIQIYIKIHEFMDKLPGGPDRVARKDNLVDRLVQEASSRNQLGGRSTQQAKSDFRSVLQNLSNFESVHKNVIGELENQLSDELSIDETEGDELNRISTEEEKIVKAAEDVKQGIQDIRNTLGINHESSPKSSDVEDKMDQIKSLGNEIDNHVQDIYSIVESEGKFENKSYRKLKNLS